MFIGINIHIQLPFQGKGIQFSSSIVSRKVGLKASVVNMEFKWSLYI